MKIEKQLKQIRKSYLKIKPPSDLVKYGWLALSKEIQVQENRRNPFMLLLGRGMVFAAMLIFLLSGGLIGLVKASQNTLPGDVLYPLKRLSESVTSAISKDKQIKVEKRAEEVVGVAKQKNDPVVLKDAVKDYQKAVSKTQQEVEKSGKKEEFQNKLKKEEQQFKDVSEQVPTSKEVLKEAIEASRKGREAEIKGIESEVKSVEIKKDPLKIQQEVEKSGKKEEIVDPLLNSK